jgi:hypothetical protein
MSCKNCTNIVIEECEESLCDGTVSLPCDFVIPASCVKNTTALPNLGNCKEVVSDYVCSDLGTILKAIDDQLTNCGVDTFVESGVLSGGTLTLTLNDDSTVAIDLSALVNATQFWARNSGSGYLYPTTLTDKVGINTNIPQHNLDVNGSFGSSTVPALNEQIKVVNDVYTINSLSGVSSALTTNMALLRYGTSSTQQSLIYSTKTVAAIAFDSTTSVAALGVSNGALSARVSSSATVYSGLRSIPTQTLLEATNGTNTTELKLTKDNLVIDSNNGWSGTFTSGTGTTVTVTKGIITNVA